MTGEIVRMGVVGACGRGASFKAACDHIPEVRVQAVCDVRAEGLAEAAERLGAEERYVEYEEMLESGRVDAVILGTPMHHHVPQAVAALRRGK